MTQEEWVDRYIAYCVAQGYKESEAIVAAVNAWDDGDESPEDRAAQDLELIG